MTYIKEVELDNFKSFAGHNKFTFINGFNVIAGANGSGKSNIIDALMFVLGGSSKKEMRSELLTDLIFNGGKAQKPAEFAKVNVILDNSDKTFPGYEEKDLSISRKIDNSGKSVFRINGKASTREEILNILAVIKVKQDSFNIIPQGKIAEIAVSSPEDRLGIINDLSGISVFEEKRDKAMTEMKKVEDNVSKIDAVQREKQRLMEELEEDKKKAEEFKELKKTQATLQSKLVLIKRNAASDALEKVRNSIAETDKASKGLVSEKEGAVGRLSTIRNEVNRINTEAEREGEKEISDAEKTAKELDVELSKLRLVSANDIEQVKNVKGDLDRIKKEINDMSASSEKENASVKEWRDKLNSLIEKRQGFTESLSKAERYFKDKENLEKNLSALKEKISDYKLALANYPKSAELQSRLSELNETKARLDAENREMTIRFSEFRPLVEKLKTNIKREEDTLYWLRESLLSQKTTMSSQSKAMIAADKLKKEIAGVHGAVSELFSVRDERYAQALFRSIGKRADFIAADDENVVSKCIEKLKREKLGSFNFIPLNKVTQTFIGKKPDFNFVIDFTINLVSFDEKFASAMRFVFGDTLLVDSFEDAKSLINKYRMVTLDGTVFEKTGVISGGYQEEVNFANINKKYKELNEGIEEHSKLKEKYEVELQEKNATLSFLMSKLKGYDKEVSDVKNNINSAAKELSNFVGSESDITNSINKLESEKFELEEKVKLLGRDKYEETDYKKEIDSLDKEINQLRVDIATSSRNLENIVKSGLADLLRKNTELEKQKSRFEGEFTVINQRIAEDERRQAAAIADLNKKSEALLKLREGRNDLLKESASLTEKLDEINVKLGDFQAKVNELRVSEADLHVRFETAEEEFKKYSLPDVKLEEGESAENLGRKILSISSKLEKFGPINELALDKFNKVLEEYNEFNEKLTKLAEEKEKILAVIKDIEAKKLEAFMKTLSDVNSVFSSVFNSMTGGKAEMVPDNPQDVFGGGLDISIDLPNKKIYNVRGLSGGEKSMLSIALLMSISKYIDVPFYVLDEVDAALDSVNSAKFSGLVKAYSENTEFVVISHNETTMLNADVIYGVTMTGEGLSKIVSVKMPKEEIKTS